MAVMAWSVLFAGIYYALRRYAKGAVVIAFLVLSHWLLDLVTHRPDLPIHPGGGLKVGLGLWNVPAVAIPLELLIFAAGVAICARTTRASDRQGTVGLWSLVAFLLAVYLGNLFGPLPPSEKAIAWSSHAQWLLVAWAYWVDAHRKPARPGGSRAVSLEAGAQ